VSLRRVLTLCARSLAGGPRSPALLLALLMPLFITFMVQVVLLALIDRAPRLGIADLGGSELASAAAEMEGIELKLARGADELRELVGANDVDAGLVLPEGFDAAVRAGERPELGLWLSGESHLASRIVLLLGALDLVRELEDRPAPAEVSLIEVGEGQGLPIEDLMVLCAVLFALIVTGIFATGSLLVGERESGTLEALLVTPITIAEVLVAKAAIGFSMAIAMCLLTLALNGALDFDPLALLASLVIAAALCAEIGLIYGSAARDSKSLYNMVKTLNILIVGPAIFYFFPSWPQWIAKLLPTYWFIDPLYRVSLRGAGLAEVGGELAVAAAIGLALLAPIALLGRRLQARPGPAWEPGFRGIGATGGDPRGPDPGAPPRLAGLTPPPSKGASMKRVVVPVLLAALCAAWWLVRPGGDGLPVEAGGPGSSVSASPAEPRGLELSAEPRESRRSAAAGSTELGGSVELWFAAAGAGVGGVRARLIPEDPDASDPIPEATSDPDGRIRWAGLPPGGYRWQLLSAHVVRMAPAPEDPATCEGEAAIFTRERLLRSMRRVSGAFQVHAREAAIHRCRVAAAGSVTGVVLIAGRPIPGAQVVVKRCEVLPGSERLPSPILDQRDEGAGSTDPGGRFLIGDLGAGPKILQVAIRQGASDHYVRSLPFRLEEGEGRDLGGIDLDSSATLEVRVLLVGGEGILPPEEVLRSVRPLRVGVAGGGLAFGLDLPIGETCRLHGVDWIDRPILDPDIAESGWELRGGIRLGRPRHLLVDSPEVELRIPVERTAEVWITAKVPLPAWSGRCRVRTPGHKSWLPATAEGFAGSLAVAGSGVPALLDWTALDGSAWLGTARLDPAAGEEVEVSLERAVVIQGTALRAASGAPLASRVLSATTRSLGAGWWPLGTSTDPAGRFSLEVPHDSAVLFRGAREELEAGLDVHGVVVHLDR